MPKMFPSKKFPRIQEFPEMTKNYCYFPKKAKNSPGTLRANKERRKNHKWSRNEGMRNNEVWGGAFLKGFGDCGNFLLFPCLFLFPSIIIGARGELMIVSDKRYNKKKPKFFARGKKGH
jgi:hypothetical protein